MEGFVLDTPDVNAVMPNAKLLAEKLCYPDGAVSQTPVKRITIFYKGSGRTITIGSSKYASATFADAVAQHFGTEVASHYRKVPIEARYITCLENYMGQRVMTEARDPNHIGHDFIREILKSVGGSLHVMYK